MAILFEDTPAIARCKVCPLVALVVKIVLLAGCACIAAFTKLLVIARLQVVRGAAGVLLLLGRSISAPVAGIAQTGVTDVTPLDWQGKLAFHAESTYDPTTMIGIAAYAGLLQEINSPAEWAAPRMASALAPLSGSALLSVAPQRVLAQVGARAARDHPYADRLRWRDFIHLAYRQCVRRSLSFQLCGIRPSRYRPAGIRGWLPGAGPQLRQQSGSGVLAGSEEKGIS
jgi:hypothetical protein